MRNQPNEVAIVLYFVVFVVFLVKIWRNKVDLSQSSIRNTVLNKLVFSWVMLSSLFIFVSWVFLFLIMLKSGSITSGLQAFADLYISALKKITGEVPADQRNLQSDL